MNQLWQYWSCRLAPAIIDEIIEVGNRYPISPTRIGFDGNVSNEQYRSSEIRWLNPSDPAVKPIMDHMWYFINEANRNAFGFDITYIPEVQYTTYYGSTNDKYDWHIDTFWANPTAYDRKISIVIQLSESDEYEGGDFQFAPEHPQMPADLIRARGSVIVFPSFLSHRVTPVTSGVRRSLVSWAQGPKFR